MYYNFIFIFGCTGSSLLCGLFSSCGEQQAHFVVVHRLLIVLSCCGAQALGHESFSSCSVWAQQLHLPGSGAQPQQLWHLAQLLCGMSVFLDQGSNPCLLHWQTDSLTLSHQGSSFYIILNENKCGFLLKGYNR